jgi:hypothetical protein
MLPAWRTAGEGFALPACDVVPSDVEGFMEENIRELKVHDPLTGGALLMVVSGDCPPGSRHGLPRGRPRDLHTRLLFHPGTMGGLWLHNGHAPCR